MKNKHLYRLSLSFLFCCVNIFVSNAQVIKECRAVPSHASVAIFDMSRVAFSTSEKRTMGLCMVEFAKTPGSQSRVYQNKSWSKAGWLGSMVITEKGDIFCAPTPSVNVEFNKKTEQNYLYKVDSKTGEMAVAIKLPTASKPNKENPFGLMGMAYDCDNQVLYVSSIYDSSFDSELGIVYAIDTKTMKIVDQIDSIDVLGIGLVSINGIKKIMFGKSRNGEIVSMFVKPNGAFQGKPYTEFFLDGLGPRGDDVARKIRMNPDGTLGIFGIEFYYNLIAPTEKQETKYTFKYVQKMGRWTQVE